LKNRFEKQWMSREQWMNVNERQLTEMMRYGKAYSDADPEMIEGDIFRIVVKYPDSAIYEKDSTVQPQATPQVARLLRVIEGEADQRVRTMYYGVQKSCFSKKGRGF